MGVSEDWIIVLSKKADELLKEKIENLDTERRKTIMREMFTIELNDKKEGNYSILYYFYYMEVWDDINYFVCRFLREFFNEIGKSEYHFYRKTNENILEYENVNELYEDEGYLNDEFCVGMNVEFKYL